MAFVEAQNNQKYLKAIIHGEAGSGKTTLATKLAINLAKETKKIYIIDTEGGADFFVADFIREGKTPFVTSDKIDTLQAFIDNFNIALKDKPDVLVIDSITHIGELCEKHFVTSGQAKDSIFNWSKAKTYWYDNFLYRVKEAPFHIIVCGRETSGMSIERKQGEKLSISYNKPQKVKLGLEIDYDLHLRIGMSIATKDDGTQVRVAKILKDRCNIIDGEEFINPVFEDIKPHIDKLAQDSEMFLELRLKLKECDSLDFLGILKNELTTAKENLTRAEIRELAYLYIEADKRLNPKQLNNDK